MQIHKVLFLFFLISRDCLQYLQKSPFTYLHQSLHVNANMAKNLELEQFHNIALSCYICCAAGRLLKSVNSLAPKSTSSARPVLIEEIEAMTAPIRKVSSVILNFNKQKSYF